MSLVPHTIVFDLGGVLIDWNPRHLYRKLFAGDEAAMETFLAEIVTFEWNHEQDAGRPFAEGIALLLERDPDQAAMIQAFHDRWPEMMGGAIEETVDIFRRLRQSGIPVYALTNFYSETFPVARESFDFMSWFNGIVVSGDEKIAKPDPRIFAILIDRYDLDPARTVYIDDLPRNVDAATQAGFTALHFTGAEKLETDLRGLGMPV
jgi:2-haloacid dehalogenase